MIPRLPSSTRRPPRALRAGVPLGLLLSLLAAGPATAHGTQPAPASVLRLERALKTQEATGLGAAHASDHARDRAIER